MLKKIGWSLVLFLLSLGLNIQAKAGLVPLTPYFQFSAGHADSCGYGGVQLYGYQYSEIGWTIHGNIPANGGNSPGNYLTWEWQLIDEAGVLASGSWDSTTSTSTGGTYGTDAGFETSRLPVGEMYFEGSGSYQSDSPPCTQSFQVTSGTLIMTNGYFFASLPTTASPIVFQSPDSGLVLQMPDNSSTNYEEPIQDYYDEQDYQQWNLTSIGGCGPYYWYGCYKFTNNGTGVPLYSDYATGGSPVYQLSGTNLAWRFISAGDGSWYIAYDQQTGGPPSTFSSYAMGPVGGSTKTEVVIEAYPRPFQQSQKWLIYRVE